MYYKRHMYFVIVILYYLKNICNLNFKYFEYKVSSNLSLKNSLME